MDGRLTYSIPTFPLGFVHSFMGALKQKKARSARQDKNILHRAFLVTCPILLEAFL